MGKTKTLTEEQKQIILTNYLDNKRGQLYCSKVAHTTVYMVKKFLREEHINIRNFSEAATVSNQNRAKSVNHDYFSNPSSNMAWMLGFLAADGCVSKSRNQIVINLSRTDRNILEIIKEEIQIENNICDYENKDGFLCSSLSWTSQKQKEDLKKYNIVPAKTLILKPPYELPKEFWIDYIRGYFDGDGTICQSGEGIRWSIGGAVKEMLEFVVNFLYEEYDIPKVNIQEQHFQNSCHTFYAIQYSTKATKKIYDILYTKNSLYLQRKKDKYQSLI